MEWVTRLLASNYGPLYLLNYMQLKLIGIGIAMERVPIRVRIVRVVTNSPLDLKLADKKSFMS